VLATVSTGIEPRQVVVNPATNRIYSINVGSTNVTVIHGATNNVLATIPVGAFPTSIALIPVTNRLYVSNTHDDNVSVIDGNTNSVIEAVPTGTDPTGTVVNPVNNKVYVVNGSGSSVTVIDGTSNSVLANVHVGEQPRGLGINPNTNKVYVSNGASGNVTVLNDATIFGNLLTAGVQRIPGNQTTDPNPTIAFFPQNNSGPITPKVLNVYYQLDTKQGKWTAATRNGDGVSWSAKLDLTKDWHTLFFFASDGSDSRSINSLVAVKAPGVVQASPVLGFIGAYGFTYTTTPTTLFLIHADAKAQGQQVKVLWSTGSELDVVGFNVLRSTERKGTYTRLNAQLVEADHQGEDQGGAYEWTDTTTTPGATFFYKVEVVGSRGPFESSKAQRADVPAICSEMPGAPKLKTPADGSVATTLPIIMKWAKQDCAATYQIQVRRKAPDGNVIEAQTTTRPRLSFNPPESTKTVKLFWQVRACNTNQVCGEWSATRRVDVLP
jgi:YVTN family beta-propeller protein